MTRNTQRPLAHLPAHANGGARPATTKYKIDPSLPLIWEASDTLRYGFDHAEARLHNLTLGAQRMLDLLAKGATFADLKQASRRAGVTASELRQILAELDSVLLTHEADQDCIGRATPFIEVVGNDLLADSLREALRRAGYQICAKDDPADLVVLVDRFFLRETHLSSPLEHQVPHLSIGTSDRSAWLGPLVDADSSPCLSCVVLNTRHDSPRYVQLAAGMLADAPVPAQNSCFDSLASIAVAAIGSWLQGSRDLKAMRLRFDLHGGELGPVPRSEPLAPHPDCGCVAFSALHLARAA